MNAMRNRVKEYFPMVLLTLLSIVQALALELLWSHLLESQYLFDSTWIALLSWVQIVATFLGLMLIWVVYASNAMRFRWVPITSDSVYPFVIGLLEFTLIETLGPDQFAWWFIIMAIIFATMVWVSHRTMHRARLDEDNHLYFKNLEPTRLRDFYSHIGMVSALVITGVLIYSTGHTGIFTMIALLATNGVLGRQFYNVAKFWENSLLVDSEERLV